MVRIENGKPRYGEDILETTLPQETEQMHAVSFNKGCYLGQEIVERIRARGHVNKHLTRSWSFDAPVPPGTKLTSTAKRPKSPSSVTIPASGKAIALAYVRA